MDELRLMVFPTSSAGQEALPRGVDRRIKLNLIDDEAVGPDGIRLLIYERAD